MGMLDAFYSLGSKINKSNGKEIDSETEEGIASEKFPELKLDMDNDALVKLTKNWKKKWEESEVYSRWIESGDENENYWKGKQFDVAKVDKNRPLVDNVLFEALETYLPQVTRRNPDPMVTLSRKEQESRENLDFVYNLQKELAEISDEIVLRLKLKKVARHWAIFLLGIVKFGWDLDKDTPTAKVVRPRKIILDPEATIDEEIGYTGEFIGEYRKMQASVLLSTLENIGGDKDGMAFIKDKIDKNLGTDITFIEWWTNQYQCWTLEGKVLYKAKNPHWNYGTQEELPYSENGEPQVDQNGKPMMKDVPGLNHFPVPKMPYSLLSVFNLGKIPVDDTSLMGQNLSSQDLVNKRVRQMDKNIDSMNGGMIVSGEKAGMTKEQAAGVSEALRRGGTVFIPSGSPSEAIKRESAPELSRDVYLQLTDTRTRMRDIFGTSGSSAAGLSSEQTVRGKLQNKMLDTDRIGGGVSEYLEQLADQVYNWFTQLLYVYDENYKDKQLPKVRISVKEGSMLPKDSLTLANQALELAGQNRMALVDLYKALDYPNPEEMAANVWLEANAPDILLSNDPRIQQVMQAKQQAESEKRPPSTSISFKDLPPDGQAQLALQAGIQLDPEAVAAYDDSKDKKDVTKNIVTELGRRAINEPTNQ